MRSIPDIPEPSDSDIPHYWPELIRLRWMGELTQIWADQDDPECRERPEPILRIANDARVFNAWEWLCKNYRPRGDPAPARAAFLTLVEEALNCYCHRAPATISRTELERERRRWRELAVTLRRQIAQLNRFATTRRRDALYFTLDPTRLESKLAEAAEEAERLANAPVFNVVERNRSDPELRGFIRQMSLVTKGRFGKPLYGILAVLATALFDHTVTRNYVRDCIRGVGLERAKTAF